MTTASQLRAALLPREALLFLFLAGTSGLAVLAHSYDALPMSFTVPFVVLPAGIVLAGAILLGQGRVGRLHAYSRALMVGAVVGLFATLLYDAVRPLITWLMGARYDPYRAMPIFGQLMTGLPGQDARSLAAGWIYHFWNGISFGMVYSLLRPRGGLLTGLAWGLALQALMMAAYPSLLQARLDDPAFMATGIVGHSLWGAALGYGVARWSTRA